MVENTIRHSTYSHIDNQVLTNKNKYSRTWNRTTEVFCMGFIPNKIKN